MILMVSGRCDIVAFYTEWFMNRYREGFVDVRNPFYPKQVSRIRMEDVDAIMFCTKNPIPILPYLKEIDKPILFHVTLTSYKKDIEPNVPDKKEIIKAIREISKIIGKENLYVRYDPILLNSYYTLSYHIRAFERLCSLLDGYVEHIIISFVDSYKNVEKNQKILQLRDFEKEDYEKIGKYFSKSAKKYGMTVQTCFEEETLEEFGFIRRDCLDANLAFRLTGKTRFKPWTARKGKKCKCVEMVDIGVYNSCKHFCKYCYANFDEKKVLENMKQHNPKSSLLVGELQKEDIVKFRKS